MTRGRRRRNPENNDKNRDGNNDENRDTPDAGNKPRRRQELHATLQQGKIEIVQHLALRTKGVEFPPHGHQVRDRLRVADWNYTQCFSSEKSKSFSISPSGP